MRASPGEKVIDGLLELDRREFERPGAAGIGDDSIPVDEEQTLGPGGVGRHHRVVHLVHVGADAVLQRCFTLPGDGAPFVHRLRVAQICSRCPGPSHP